MVSRSALPPEFSGIAFIGGKAPPPFVCKEIAKSADIIVAADSGLISAERAGVSPHWIVGDMDSLDTLKRLEAYPKERILVYAKDKDYTDTELALGLLWEKGCTWTALVGGGGGRTDHILALHSLFERTPCANRWITNQEDMYALGCGQTLQLEPQIGSIVSVFPLGEAPWRIKSSGLKWPLDALRWDKGFFSISNIALSTLSLESIEGRFLIITTPALPPAPVKFPRIIK